MNPLLLIMRFARVLSPSLALRAGAGLGACYAGLGLRDGRRADAHLARAFPKASAHWRRRLQRRCFAHMGAMALWTLSSMGREQGQLLRGVRVEGGAHLRATLARSRQGQGTVIATAHFGNWELFGRLMGPVAPLTVIGRRMRSAMLDQAIKWLRTGTGAQQIDQQQGLRPLLNDLRAGRAIACLIDQDIPALAGAFVPWFGEAAYTPVGPALLTSMVPGTHFQVALCRRHGRGWCIHFSPAWPWPAGERQQAAAELTARATEYLEGQVRRHPEQWVWWHKRWRTRPADRPRAVQIDTSIKDNA